MRRVLNSIWPAAGVVFKKELKDGLRDWRSLLTMMFYPVFGPVMMVVVFAQISDSTHEPDQVELPVVAADRAPGLIDWLEQHNVAITVAPDEPERAIREGELFMVIRIPEDYSEKLAAGKPVAIELLLDKTKNEHTGAIRKTTRLIEGFGRQIGALRLIARGVNPQLALLAPSIQMLVSVYARSYKEAQAYMTLLILLPMVPFFARATTHSALWKYAVPVLSQQCLMNDVLNGQSPAWGVLLPTGLVSALIGLAGVWLTARLFKKESIVFGR